MDFVDWCSRVLSAMADVMSTSTQARSIGVSDLELAAVLFGKDAVYGATGFHGSEHQSALHDALIGLERESLVVQGTTKRWRINSQGEIALRNWLLPWEAMCQLVSEQLIPERQRLLEAVNRLSPREADSYARLVWVPHEEVLQEFGWADGMSRLRAVAGELKERGLVGHH